MTVEGFAPAKVNLTLHVTGQRDDGYHVLDSLVVFADVGDRLWVSPDDGLSLTVTGPMAAGVPTDGRNLVLQAAELAGIRDVAIRLEKHLPAEAGIGGGSSDAAATLRGLSALFDIPLLAQSERLGADVPVCLEATAARMTGTGEQVTSVSNLPDLPAVLINPGVPVATPPVFKALTRKVNSPMPKALPRFQAVKDVLAWLATQRNDLQAPAIALHPEIGQALQHLRQLPEVGLARMSGSGASCFALFEHRDQADQAAAQLRQERPEWWVQSCTLR